jgi:hypothetical protein
MGNCAQNGAQANEDERFADSLGSVITRDTWPGHTQWSKAPAYFREVRHKRQVHTWWSGAEPVSSGAEPVSCGACTHAAHRAVWLR